MSSELEYWLPRLLLLAVLSPWLGMLTLLATRRRPPLPIHQLVFINTILTALLMSVVWGLQTGTSRSLAQNPAEFEHGGWGFHAVRAIWSSPAVTSQSPPWRVEFGLSLGVDDLNVDPLFLCSWLAAVSMIVSSRRHQLTIGIGVGALALEGSLLAAFAAQDAITFCLAAELNLLCVCWLVGAHGGPQRRETVERYFSWQHAGQLLWLTGWLGMGLATVWVQQDLRREAPAISFGWTELAQTLPRLTSRYITSLEYWSGAAPLLVTALVVGTVLRAGLMPVHGSSLSLLRESRGPFSGLVAAGMTMLVPYVFQRGIAPVLVNDDTLSWLFWLGACTGLAGGLLALAQVELRRFATCWWLGCTGSVWIALASSIPELQQAGWAMTQSISISLAGWLLVQEEIEHRSDRIRIDQYGGLASRFPKLAIAGAGSLLIAIGWPTVSHGGSDVWLATGGVRQASTGWWLAIGGWICLSWATIWMYQQIFFGSWKEDRPTPAGSHQFQGGEGAILWGGRAEPSPAGRTLLTAPDLSRTEFAAFLLLLSLPVLCWLATLWRGEA